MRRAAEFEPRDQKAVLFRRTSPDPGCEQLASGCTLRTQPQCLRAAQIIGRVEVRVNGDRVRPVQAAAIALANDMPFAVHIRGRPSGGATVFETVTSAAVGSVAFVAVVTVGVGGAARVAVRGTAVGVFANGTAVSAGDEAHPASRISAGTAMIARQGIVIRTYHFFRSRYHFTCSRPFIRMTT
jgi:hypothetical protein